MMFSMRVREHPKIMSWPPTPGGTNTAPQPEAESQAIIKVVHVSSAVDVSVPLSGEFRGNLFTYDVITKEPAFAKRLAKEFSHHVGSTLEQLGNLDIDF
jgi:hypothetical protein